MKKTLIENLHRPQIIEQSMRLFDFIEVNYGISEADERFVDYFVNYLIQYYKHLTFEDLESAFERNASGLLDIYLPKIGQRVDNKVLKFNIPDLTKIINAYCKYKGIEKSEKNQQKKIFTQEEKQKIRTEWIELLCYRFDSYKNGKREQFKVPLYTCKVLSDLGILDASRIDYSEAPIKYIIGGISSRTNNENLIFECFDSIIKQEMHIRDFIGSFAEYKQKEDIPF